MENGTIREQLKSFAGTHKKVRLTRSIPGERDLNGFVVAVGPRWMLLYQFHDFIPDGYTVLRIEDITNIRSGDYERHWERMLAEEGALGQLVAPLDVPLKSLLRLLQELQLRGDNVIVECERLDDDNEGFYIGQILSVDSVNLQFANFDALGHWDEEPDTILLEEITRLQLDTPYARTFAKYLDGPCPHAG